MTPLGRMPVLFRRIAANPAFAGVAVLTLAIAIAANLVIFTVVNAVVLRPLPYPGADRIVGLRHAMPGFAQMDEVGMSPGLYFTYLNEGRTLEHLAIFNDTAGNLTSPDTTERVQFGIVTASLFDVLNVAPQLGRPFTVEDERPGAPPVVILSAGLWHARFGSDPATVGRLVEIDRVPTEIVGVMPEQFTFADPEIRAWRPMELNETERNLGSFCCAGFGRLSDDASVQAAQVELRTLATNLASLQPDVANAEVLVNAGLMPIVEPAHESMTRDIRATLWILLGAVSVLLLIACANVTNLFLVRAETRHREISIRRALGESPLRLRGSVLTESIVMGLVGGLAALPLAVAGVRLVIRYGPEDLPRLHEVSMDASVLIFGFILSVVAGFVFGLVPALRAGAVTAAASLADGARGASAGRERHVVRRSLVVAQVALALTLLVGSGLAVRSFQRLAGVDLGFDPRDVLTLSVALPERDYGTDESRLAFHRQVVEQLEAIPGVVSASATSNLPMRSVRGAGHAFEDQPRAEGEVPPILFMKWVSPNYFETMSIAMLEGRDFEILDEARGGLVSIVSDVVARTYWPDQAVLGKGIRAGTGRPDDNWYRVIGVVENTHEFAIHQDQPEIVYYSLTGPGDVPSSMSYVIRAESSTNLGTAARSVVQSVDPRLAVSDMVTMEAIVGESQGERAFVMFLLMAAAAAALLLGSVGLYGVVSYMVAQRRREIAIRMAIGAQISNITRLVLGEALGLALAGVGLGLGLAFALTRRLEALLFETSPVDPMVLVMVSAVLVTVCLSASWLPARRAARTQPLTALRLE
jgi:putative ABC transport system permease protein